METMHTAVQPVAQHIDAKVLSLQHADGFEDSLFCAFRALTKVPELDQAIAVTDSLGKALRTRVEKTLQRALTDGDENALTDLHRSLFLLYELQIADPADCAATNQFSPFLVELRGNIERHWLQMECERLGPLPALTTPNDLVAAIKTAVSTHPASKHRLFDELQHTASRAQFENFFRSDTALNVRFFDLLVMSMIGSAPETRKELASNFWDEMGRGDQQSNHVNLFRHLLRDLGIAESEDNFASELSWQGLRGYNLFMLCAVNRQHYFRLLGVMAATELLDPPQYRKLIAGCRRLGIGSSTTRYYDEHASIDEVHGDGWLENVIRPLAAREPRVMPEVLQGCMLRLATCHDYYDALCQQLLRSISDASSVNAWSDDTYDGIKDKCCAVQNARKDEG